MRTITPLGTYDFVRRTVLFRCNTPWPRLGERVKVKLAPTYSIFATITDIDSRGILTGFVYGKVRPRHIKDGPDNPVRVVTKPTHMVNNEDWEFAPHDQYNIQPKPGVDITGEEV